MKQASELARRNFFIDLHRYKLSLCMSFPLYNFIGWGNLQKLLGKYEVLNTQKASEK